MKPPSGFEGDQGCGRFFLVRGAHDRPCLFATDVPDPKKPGRIRRVYRATSAMTPLDKLASLPEAHKFLREDVTLEHLHQLARALTDVQAAEELNEARAALFRRVPARTG